MDQVWGQYGWVLAKFFFCKSIVREEVNKNAKQNEADILPDWPNKFGQ